MSSDDRYHLSFDMPYGRIPLLQTVVCEASPNCNALCLLPTNTVQMHGTVTVAPRKVAQTAGLLIYIGEVPGLNLGQGTGYSH
jgi:hypothetical protein